MQVQWLSISQRLTRPLNPSKLGRIRTSCSARRPVGLTVYRARHPARLRLSLWVSGLEPTALTAALGNRRPQHQRPPLEPWVSRPEPVVLALQWAVFDAALRAGAHVLRRHPRRVASDVEAEIARRLLRTRPPVFTCARDRGHPTCSSFSRACCRGLALNGTHKIHFDVHKQYRCATTVR
ncbi:hypothetical protein B0H15DRAFT_33164 [Mycena belliarum]|uniref:Uncharacterized protein n=1 Tax=Mycena belliarum TaxID=1033014 RepID=A0AAD6XR21_9AGAR|nr:hypothetical protein B0H15DRAFT_33164 [Mycena belliae]